MSATEPLYQMIGVSFDKLSKEEVFILEAELFVRICEELDEAVRSNHKDYFRLIKSNEEMERVMLSVSSVRHVINDILFTGEYSVEGIACYTQTSEDVICDLITGKNSSPSVDLFFKIINLHRTIRKNFYDKIIKKIAEEYLVA